MPAKSHLLILSKRTLMAWLFSLQKSHLIMLSRCWLDRGNSVAGDYTYVKMIKHCMAYQLTYSDWCHMQNEVYWNPTFFFQNSKFRYRNSNFSIFQQRNSKKNSDRNLRNQKRNRNSASDWGPRNQNQKSEFPTKLRSFINLYTTFTLENDQIVQFICEKWWFICTYTIF